LELLKLTFAPLLHKKEFT